MHRRIYSRTRKIRYSRKEKPFLINVLKMHRKSQLSEEVVKLGLSDWALDKAISYMGFVPKLTAIKIIN